MNHMLNLPGENVALNVYRLHSIHFRNGEANVRMENETIFVTKAEDIEVLKAWVEINKVGLNLEYHRRKQAKLQKAESQSSGGTDSIVPKFSGF